MKLLYVSFISQKINPIFPHAMELRDNVSAFKLKCYSTYFFISLSLLVRLTFIIMLALVAITIATIIVGSTVTFIHLFLKKDNRLEFGIL